MPELPDLQIFSKNLHQKLAGKTLQKITVYKSPKLKVTERELNEKLKGKALESIYREGKELRLKFENDQLLGLHLMLNGKLFLYTNESSHKHPIVDLLFEDKTGLVLTDFQGMANVSFNPEEGKTPDALSNDLTASYLEEKLKRTGSPIKKLLMDQKVIKGIGNAYADEILWEARISPLSVCKKMPEEKIKELLAAIKSVLKHAEAELTRLHPDIINGEIRDFLKIHSPKNAASPTGAEIKVTTIGGRKTYYTDEQEKFS